MRPHFRGQLHGRVFYVAEDGLEELTPGHPFEWWKPGAEQTDLACSMLYRVAGSYRAAQYASRFAREIVGQLPAVGFTVDADVVRVWLAEVSSAHGAASQPGRSA